MREPSDGADPVDPAAKRMRLRYPGVCRECGVQIAARTEAFYERETKTVRCVDCTPEGPGASPAVDLPPSSGFDEPDTDAGVAGSSARREYERRKARDEQRLRDTWGRFGRLAVVLSDEKQSTKAWDVGATGEERLGRLLDTLACESIAVLHDRRIPRTRANIDHLVVTRQGVWVVDAKRYVGRPELKVEGGLLRPRVEKVLVGRRDCTSLVDGVLRQVRVVRESLDDVDVIGAMCFVGADWPLFGGAFTTRDVQVLWPKRLVKLLAAQGDGPVDVAATRKILAARLASA